MSSSRHKSALEFQRTLRQVTGEARRAVKDLWDTTDDWEQFKDAYPELVRRYASAAGVLAEQWYHDLAPDKPFEVRAGALPDVEALRGTVGWALSLDDPLDGLQGASDRYVATTARETVVSNAKRERVKFFRVAEPDACDWCQMLADDARYLSEESAAASHDRCLCTVAPDR